MPKATPGACKPGTKLDAGKLQWSLLPLRLLEPVVRVLMFGARKYAPDNWKHVPDALDRYYDATIRHVTSWQDGERTDPETGESHLAHAICCLLFMLWHEAKDQRGRPPVEI